MRAGHATPAIRRRPGGSTRSLSTAAARSTRSTRARIRTSSTVASTKPCTPGIRRQPRPKTNAWPNGATRAAIQVIAGRRGNYPWPGMHSSRSAVSSTPHASQAIPNALGPYSRWVGSISVSDVQRRGADGRASAWSRPDADRQGCAGLGPPCWRAWPNSKRKLETPTKRSARFRNCSRCRQVKQ